MARLVLNCEGVDLGTHELGGDIVSIRRAPLNHIVIDHSTVSGQHALAVTHTVRTNYSHSRYALSFALNAPLGPGQLNTSDGVTACIALASTGGVEGSFFTAQRCSP